MKKLFNQRKKPYDEENIDWDEAEYEEGAYYEDGIEYADDEAAEDEDSAFYEEAEAYEEEESGEYYEEEEYYAAEEASEEELYEDEIYEDEIYEEDSAVYEDEYEEDDIAYEDAYEEEDYEEDEFGNRKRRRLPAGGNFFAKLWHALVHMNTMDRVVVTTGVMVLILALVTGAVYISATILNKQVASFEEIGSQLAGINIIGEAGLTAVADAELARINAANAVEDDEQDKEYEENEYVKEVTVELNLTSIEKDLKVKFVNSKTNKLIGNVPFSVTVTTPGGKTETWTDEDMDGIIYKKDIKSGNYTVAMEPLEGEKYKDYIISGDGRKVEVKDKVEYKKVDVSDEIKNESEIDASVEDTAKNEVAVESELKDTVSWVDSTQAVTYTEVKKNQIKDPATASLATSFQRLSGETVTLTGGSSVSVGGTLTLTPQKSGGEGSWTLDSGTWSSSKPEIATVSNGTVTGVAAGKATITYEWKGTVQGTASGGNGSGTAVSGTATCEIEVTAVDGVVKVTVSPATLNLDVSKKETATGNVTATVEVTGAASKDVKWASSNPAVATVTAGADGKAVVTALSAGTATITATSQADPGKSASCTVTVTGVVPTVLTLDKNTLSLPVDGTYKLTATTTPAGAAVVWTSDKPEIAKAAADGTITGVKEGTAVITATTANGLTQKCTVTVTKLMTLDKATASVAVGSETTVTVKPADDGKGKVAAFSGNDKIVTVSVKDKVVTLKGIQKGSAAVTIVYTSAKGQTVSQDITVTVVDGSGKLKDGEGNVLYIKNADGTYTEALSGDYYKYDTFYVKQVKYTGWQTIDGKVYFYDANGKFVTGEQVIQGAKYNFASDGSLVTGNGTFGIDVSKWNGTIDWNAVKNSGVSYVIIRCGYRGSSAGTLVEDPKFKANIKGATSAGIKVGVYFFSQAVNNSEAVEEASMVLQLIKDYKISYPVFLDVESSGGRADKIDSVTRTEVIKSFCQTIENGGYTAGVYANKNWLNTKMDAKQLTKYKIWLAQYAAAPTYTTTKYDLWQYKSTGKVSGISGNVDLNISYLGY